MPGVRRRSRWHEIRCGAAWRDRPFPLISDNDAVAAEAFDAIRGRNDFMRGDLRPGAKIVFMDQPLTVNQWGMRDYEYPLEKPAGTYRIALLGPSHVMGSGVADGETFADFLEDRLNRDAAPATGVRYEVLNFGMAGFPILQQAAMLEERALKFGPDVVIVTDSSRIKAAVVSHLLGVVSRRIPIPFPGLDELVGRTGVADDGLPVPFVSARAVLNGIGIEAGSLGSATTLSNSGRRGFQSSTKNQGA